MPIFADGRNLDIHSVTPFEALHQLMQKPKFVRIKIL